MKEAGGILRYRDEKRGSCCTILPAFLTYPAPSLLLLEHSEYFYLPILEILGKYLVFPAVIQVSSKP